MNRTYCRGCQTILVSSLEVFVDPKKICTHFVVFDLVVRVFVIFVVCYLRRFIRCSVSCKKLSVNRKVSHKLADYSSS